MTQLSDSEHKRMVDLWRVAYNPSSELGEKNNAFAALKGLQRDLALRGPVLSDADIAFICEATINADSAPSEEPPDALRQIIGLFDELHIIFPSRAHALVVALWILHTWVFEMFLHSPRLLVQSSEPECGKTTLFMCLEQLVRNGDYSDDFTPATLYRQLRNHPDTTFLFDEVDNSSLWAPDRLLRKVANAGHRQGGNVRRVIDNDIIRLPCFAPLAMAGIAKLKFPAPLLTRSIVVDLEQRLEEGRDEIEPDNPKCANARIAIADWASTFQRRQNVRVPFSGRAGNNWRVHVEIAESLGYGETARAVARAIHRPEDNPVVVLLSDIRKVFEGRKIDRVWTEVDLLPALREFGWDEFWGLSDDEDPHPLTRAELYRLLKPKKIRSQPVWKRVGGQRVCNKGFVRAQFEAIWRELFPGTASQFNKIIALPRHGRRHSGGTGGDDIDHTDDDAESATGGE